MKNISKAQVQSNSSAARFRRSLLASACVLAVGSIASTAAVAQSGAYSLTFGTPVSTQSLTFSDYVLWITTPPQYNNGVLINASNSGTTQGSLLAGVGGSTPQTVTNKFAEASSAGNYSSSTIDLGLISNPVGASDGIAAMTSQVQGGDAAAARAVTSSVVNSVIRIGVTTHQAATMVISGNNSTATTTLNESHNSVAGTTPTGYVSGQTGSIIASSTPAGIASNTTGSVNLTSHQTSLNGGSRSGSSATVTGSSTFLDINQNIGAASSNLTVSNNNIDALFNGNVATNIFQAQSLPAPGSAALQGSVVVVNGQANIETAGAPATTASVATSSIYADIRDSALGQTLLTAPLDISGNTVQAASTGNTAGARTTSGAILAGNAIILERGADFTGNGIANGLNSLDIGNSTLDATLGGDLALLNAQGNQGTALISTVTAGAVTVQADNVGATGKINSIGNTVSVNSTGNLAGNLVATDVVNFNGVVAAGNLQTNDATTITATNTTGAVTVGVGITGATVAGAIAVNENNVSAVAQGSAAATTLSLEATNLTSLRPGGASSTALSNPSGFGNVSSLAGATANNMQGNYGAATPITATVTGATVAANIVNQSGVLGARVPIAGALITANENAIEGKAGGNSAATAVDLWGTSVDAQAMVGNTQFNGNLITGTVTNSGVSVTAGGVSAASAISVNTNTVAASATANQASNRVGAGTDVDGLPHAVTDLNAGPSTFAATTNVNSNGVTAESNAAFGIASGQRNEAAVVSSNITTGAFALVDVGATGVAGVSASNLTVNNNSGTSSTTGNSASNVVDLNTTNLTTTGGAATQIGGISNLQDNTLAGASTATVGRAALGGLLVGVQFQESMVGSNVSVGSNNVAATNVGNSATNDMNVTGANSLTSSAPLVTTGGISSSSATGIGSIQNEFAVQNRQIDTSVSRGATAQNVTIGIDDTSPLIAAGVSGSNLSVQKNTVSATAHNNESLNTVDLTGFATLRTGASVLNEQSSTTPASAAVVDRLRIRAGSTAVSDSHLSLTENHVTASAVGSLATSRITAEATNLGGNANIAAGTGGTSYNPATAMTTNADYGVVNRQAQTGAVTSSVNSAMQINLDNATTTGGTATMTDNTVTSQAQSTSAQNDLKLTGVNVNNGVTGVSGAVASVQSASGDVSATQVVPALVGENLSFAVQALSTTNTPVVVSDNTIVVSAGQNEVSNAVTVSAVTITGAGRGNNISAYVPATGVATAGTDFSVVNVQAGGLGNVTANAQPGVIGATVSTITGGSTVVNGNKVTAKANVNTATNSLALNAESGLAATGAINNAQTTTAGSAVLATLGTTIPTTVGVSPLAVPGNGSVLNGTTATVSGNNLTAQAGGNTSTNDLVATAAGSIGGSATNPTFAVLNYQNNAAGMTATVGAALTSTTIGIVANGGAGGSLTNTASAVLGNQVVASAYGNSASNSLTMSTLTGSSNQASAGISNTQFNSANISSTITGVTIGVMGGSASGGSIVVSGGGTSAQAVGNSAVNKIVGK